MTVDGTIRGKNEYEGTNPPEAKSETAVAEHDTLKYRLLGPSLTKPGQDTVDQRKVCPAGYLTRPLPNAPV